MSSSDSSIFRRTLRHFKVAGRDTMLEYRDRSELPWIGQLTSLPEMLLDTTVYIDQLQGKLPRIVEESLRAASLWHSTVTEAEMSVLAGRLDPNHPNSLQAVDGVIASMEERPAHRIVNPDRDIWREAGILTGLLARLQRYGKAEQRRAMNDALIFLSAAKAGLTVLTRNIADYDLLMQLAPQGKAVFYDAG